MQSAERILRKYAGQNPNLAVWHCKMPTPRHPDFEVDMLLVGMPDDTKPEQPSDLLVFQTYFTGSESLTMELFDEVGGRSSSLMTYLSNKPLKELEEYAKVLPTL